MTGNGHSLFGYWYDRFELGFGAHQVIGSEDPTSITCIRSWSSSGNLRRLFSLLISRRTRRIGPVGLLRERRLHSSVICAFPAKLTGRIALTPLSGNLAPYQLGPRKRRETSTQQLTRALRLSWSGRCPGLEVLRRIPEGTVLDGELVRPGPSGRSEFGAVLSRHQLSSPARRDGRSPGPQRKTCIKRP